MVHPGRHKIWAITIASIVLCACKGGGGGGDSGAIGGTGGGNNQPTITGQPSTMVLQGVPYSFQPTANDRDGNRLAFTASNLPPWLSLNTSTGQVSGTPANTDVGTYSGISITVSDGTSSAALGPFSITVSASGSGSASLSWQPPQANTDGSQLSDLAGYVVLYGTGPDDLAMSVSITNPSVSRYVIENLTSGTWYFAVQAVNSSGMRSALSGMASKTIS